MAENETNFDIKLGVAGSANVESAAASLEALEKHLIGATSAASQAAEAVKAGEASYKAQEAAADRAAKALERINVQMESASGAQLDKLISKQSAATAALDRSKQALAGEATSLDALTSAAAAAANEHANLAKTISAVKAQADAVVKAEKAEAAAMAETLKAIKMVNAATTKGFLDRSNASVKSADIASKAAKAQADAAAKAAHASKGNGNLGKLSGALNQLGGPLGKVSGQATGAADAIGDLTETVGAAGPYVALAVVVLALGTAMVTATVAAAAWAISMADAARGTKELEKRSERLKKLTTSLFAGPKVQGAFDKFLSGLDSLIDLFDENNASGKAMRAVFDDIFGTLIDGAANILPTIRSAFIQVEIYILKALIAIKPFGSTFVTIAKVIGVALLVVVGIIGVVVGVIVGMAAVAGALVIGLGYLGFKIGELIAQGVKWAASIIGGPGAAFDWLMNKVNSVIEFLKSFSLADIGKAMIDGLVAGITGAAGAILSAMTGAVGGAIDGAKKLLGIASPSKVFAEIGVNTAEGMAQGVEGSTGDVKGSLESMVSPPEARPDSSVSAPSSRGSSLNLAGAQFIFQGVEGAEDAESRFGALLTRLLEGDASQLGTGAV